MSSASSNTQPSKTEPKKATTKTERKTTSSSLNVATHIIPMYDQTDEVILDPTCDSPRFIRKPRMKIIERIEKEEKAVKAVEVETPTIQVMAQINKRRFWECKQKISLSAVTCRCGYTFCNKHRYAEEHSCRFDFRRLAKRKLEEENPKVVPLKVIRIN